MKFDMKQLQDMADKAVDRATHITEEIRKATESMAEKKTDGSSTRQAPASRPRASAKRSARESDGTSWIRSMDHRTKVVFSVLLGVIVFLLILVGIIGCGSSRSTTDVPVTDNRIAMPESAESFAGKQYEDVVMRLQSAGFTNVQTEKQPDLITGWMTKEGEVEQVSVNGDTDFTAYEKFDPNATIIVTYHAFPDKDTASDSGSDTDATGGDADADDAVNGADSDDTEQSQDESQSTQSEPITAQNNAEFAALLTGPETGDPVRSFAERYAGQTIAFDGYTADVQPHDGAKTRFDYLILAGDAGASHGGPNFRFTDVNYYDLHLSDDAPDSFGVGLNIHVEATIVRYDPNTSWFELKPVSITMR